MLTNTLMKDQYSPAAPNFGGEFANLVPTKYFGGRAWASMTDSLTCDVQVLDRPEINLTITVTKHRDLDIAEQRLVELSNALRRLAAIEENADGYQSKAVEDTAFRPAAELYVLGSGRCCSPHLSPSPDGGIDLIWDINGRELNITVYNEDRCWVYLEGDASDEIEAEMPLGEARRLVSKALASR